METGKSQRPWESAIGLHIMIPLQSRLGALHCASAPFSGSVVVMAHTPTRPSQIEGLNFDSSPCDQKSHSFPSGSDHIVASNARTIPTGSTAMIGSVHVSPRSPLYATKT